MTKSNSGTIVLPAGLGSNLLLFFTDIYHLSFNLLYEEHPFLCGVQETVLLVLFFIFSTLGFYFLKYYSFLRWCPGDSTATRLLPNEFLYVCIGLQNLSPSISTTAATAGFTSRL